MAFRYPPTGTYTFDALADAETAFNFTGPGGTGVQVADTDTYWCWTDVDTPSTGVGPEYGVGGDPDGYLYNECSAPGAFDDEYYMELDQTLDASANNIEIQFKTNQRGDDCNSTCVVETNENAAGWVERGSTFGGTGDPNKVGTGVAQIWAQRSVDLTGLISHASTRIRIKVVAGSAGTTWHNDYGIDEVVFIGTAAASVEQEGFRFYADGTESGSTALEDQDVDLEIAKETTFQERVILNATGDPGSEQYQLEYKETSDGAGEWRKVPLT